MPTAADILVGIYLIIKDEMPSRISAGVGNHPPFITRSLLTVKLQFLSYSDLVR